MDDRLQQGQRAEAGDGAARVAVLRDRLRAGEVWLGSLATAAYWGDEAARSALGVPGEVWLARRMLQARASAPPALGVWPELARSLLHLEYLIWPYRDTHEQLDARQGAQRQRELGFGRRAAAALARALLERASEPSTQARAALRRYEELALESSPAETPALQRPEHEPPSEFWRLLAWGGPTLNERWVACEEALGADELARVVQADLLPLALGDGDPLAERVQGS